MAQYLAIAEVDHAGDVHLHLISDEVADDLHNPDSPGGVYLEAVIVSIESDDIEDVRTAALASHASNTAHRLALHAGMKMREAADAAAQFHKAAEEYEAEHGELPLVSAPVLPKQWEDAETIAQFEAARRVYESRPKKG